MAAHGPQLRFLWGFSGFSAEALAAWPGPGSGLGRGQCGSRAAGAGPARSLPRRCCPAEARGSDGCSGEGVRLLCGLSSPWGEGKVMSLCMHTHVHVCVCMCHCVVRVCSRATGLSVCGFVSLSIGRCCRETWGVMGLGEPQHWAARPEGPQAVGLVPEFWPGHAAPRGCRGSCAAPSAGRPGSSSQEKRCPGETAISSKASLLHRKSRLPARRTAPFVLSGV